MDLRFDELLAENQDLYLYENDDGRVLFRTLPYRKYATVKHIMSLYPNFIETIQDSVWDQCVLEHTLLSGADKDHLKAGDVSTVVDLIIKKSCSTNPDEANQELDQARAYLQDAVQQAIIFICEAFPSYLPEDLEKLTWMKILKRLAQAEQILGKSFEFRGTTSTPQDDSGKIFSELNSRAQETMIDEISKQGMDFNKENAQFHTEEWGNPSGDFNLHNLRG
jgi:hypothetical protein